MATVEGLFNFDEKLLARDVAGQRQDYMFGNNMPKGYGAVGMGWNQMLRGLFNNNDPILKEKALAEEALQMTQQQLGGDMTDPSKMYGLLMKNLNQLGASPQSVSQVADKKAIIDSTATQTSIDNSLKMMAIDDKRRAGVQEDKEKLRTQTERVVTQISKELSGDSLTQAKSDVLQAADRLSDGDDKAAMPFGTVVLNELTKIVDGLTPEDQFNSQSLLAEALKNAEENFTWQEGGILGFGEAGRWVEKGATQTTPSSSIGADPELQKVMKEIDGTE